MLFSNLLVAIALTVLFPLGLMGLLAAGEWLERRTLATEEVEAMVLEETAHVVAQYWSATGRSAPAPSNGDGPPPATRNGGGRHLRRSAQGRGGRHARRR